ncbi:MAG TPA: phosphoribosyltransferase family protein [Acidimicrobiales bacterium]|nr:phosphoribosyltransferase family protein [Acidimicrobiales bacterium]
MHPELAPLAEYRERLGRVVRTHPGVLLHLDEPIRLASGDLSRDFVDAKLAIDEPEAFRTAGEAMCRAAADAGAAFAAVGGLLVGAAPFTFAVSTVAGSRWFLVRTEPKGRGTDRWTEGTRLTEGMPVMLVDDVVTRGESIQKACERVEAEGAVVVFATALVDRADFSRRWFDRRGVPYEPILTYRDLGIEPVAGEDQPAAG